MARKNVHVKANKMLLALAWLAVQAMPDCRDAPYNGGGILGAFSRCNAAAACDYCTRRQVSFDFLCCEGHEGYPAVHILNPLVFYVFWQHAWATFVYVVAIETVEVGWVALVGDLPASLEADGFAESLAGLLLGAVLICTTLAILLGYWLIRAFDVPGPLTGTDAKTTDMWYRAALIGAWFVAQSTMFLSILVPWPAGFITYFVTLAVLLFVYGLIFGAGTPNANSHVWGDPAVYSVFRRRAFYWTFAFIVLVIGTPMAAGSGSFMANDWYIAWIFAGSMAAILAIVSLAKTCLCNGPRWGATFFLDLFLVFAAIGLVLFVEYAIREPTANTLLVVGCIFFFLGLFGILGTVIERSVYLTNEKYTKTEESQPLVQEATIAKERAQLFRKRKQQIIFT